jgi:hypothetical protein
MLLRRARITFGNMSSWVATWHPCHIAKNEEAFVESKRGTRFPLCSSMLSVVKSLLSAELRPTDNREPYCCLLNKLS